MHKLDKDLSANRVSLDNGAKMSPKRRTFLSLVFACICLSKSLLLLIVGHFANLSRITQGCFDNCRMTTFLRKKKTSFLFCCLGYLSQIEKDERDGRLLPSSEGNISVSLVFPLKLIKRSIQ